MFDVSQSLENELNQIEDTFRHPNLIIEAIRDMQTKQDESLRDIQSKLNEMTKIKDNLKAKNEFRPNLSLLNKEEETFYLVQLDLRRNIA